MSDLLQGDELAMVSVMASTLSRTNQVNRTVEAYYEGSRRAKTLGISIPPSMRSVRAVIGWPGIVVDSIEERLDLLGFAGATDFGVDEVFADNELDVESGMGHLDALIFGTAFVAVTAGLSSDEPDVVVSVESPKNATGIINHRAHTLDAGLVLDEMSSATGQTIRTGVLLTRGEMVRVRGVDERWEAVDRQPHSMGIVPMVPLINRRRSSRFYGRSEITRPIRYYTDVAVRTILGMEVNREFYSSPQRWAMGVSEEDFEADSSGALTGWEAILGKVWAMGKDEDGVLPQVGQFPSVSPAPYIDQLRALSQLIAADGAVPRNYLGFITENPSSADAIRAEESRLVKHAERRQRAFGNSWRRVARLIAAANGDVPDDFNARVRPLWADAATPTRAASADAATKLVGAGILPPTSSVTLGMAGFSTDEQDQIATDRAAAPATDLASLAGAIGRQAGAETGPTGV